MGRPIPNWVEEDLNVPRETFDRIDQVLRTLDDWRGRFNLIGPGEWGRVWERHVLDSLQLLPLLPKGDLIDLGSGAGFPGLIIAAARRGPDAGTVTMVESVAKKCAFLNAAIADAGLNANVFNARVEDVVPDQRACVTARAFAPMPKLLAYAEPWLGKGAVGVFPKGKTWEEELTEAKKTWTFASETIPSQTSDDGVILRISELRRD